MVVLAYTTTYINAIPTSDEAPEPHSLVLLKYTGDNGVAYHRFLES